MTDTSWIADLDAQAAADALVETHAAMVEAEAKEFALAAHWADLHAPEKLAGSVLPGTESARRFGGEGTPEVGEFAAGELGALIGKGLGAASTLMADALDVRHRLPQLWAAVHAKSVRVWQAREVAKRTRVTGLTPAQTVWVDGSTTPYLSSLPWTRFCDLLDAKIVEVDPGAAERRCEAAALERFVVTGQCNEFGLKTVIAKAQAGDVIFFVAMCDRIAQILELEGDTDPVGARRSKALGILANPTRAFALLAGYAVDQPLDADDGSVQTETGPDSDPGLDPGPGPGRRPGATVRDASTREMAGDPTAFLKAVGLDPTKLLPAVTLYLHISEESWSAALAGGSEGVARMEGVGPITIGQCRELLTHTHVTIQPVIDLAEDHPVDGYEVPVRMREQLRLRTPAPVFPYSSGISRRTDADHTEPYLPPARGGPPGQTRISNLGPLGRTGHRIKTHAPGWRHHQPVPGVYLWRTPHGYWFRVDHAGTHPLGKDTPVETVPPAASYESPLEHAFMQLLEAA